jgi:hypothetical protein
MLTRVHALADQQGDASPFIQQACSPTAILREDSCGYGVRRGIHWSEKGCWLRTDCRALGCSTAAKAALPCPYSMKPESEVATRASGDGMSKNQTKPADSQIRRRARSAVAAIAVKTHSAQRRLQKTNGETSGSAPMKTTPNLRWRLSAGSVHSGVRVSEPHLPPCLDPGQLVSDDGISEHSWTDVSIFSVTNAQQHHVAHVSTAISTDNQTDRGRQAARNVAGAASLSRCLK